MGAAVLDKEVVLQRIVFGTSEAEKCLWKPELVPNFLTPFKWVVSTCFESSALVPSNYRVRRGFCGNVETVFKFTYQVNILCFFHAKNPELWEALVIAADHASVWLGPTFLFSISSGCLFIVRISIALLSFSVINCTPFTFKHLGNCEWGSLGGWVCVRNLRLVRCSCLGKNLWQKRVGLSAPFPGLSSEKLSQNYRHGNWIVQLSFWDLTRIHFEIFIFLKCATLAGVRCQVGQTSLPQAGEKAIIRPAAIWSRETLLALMVLAMISEGVELKNRLPNVLLMAA